MLKDLKGLKVQHKELRVQQVFKDQQEMLVLIVVSKVLKVPKEVKEHKVLKELKGLIQVLKVR